MLKPKDMVFKGIKVDFLSNDLKCLSPRYYIVYEHMGTVYQGYSGNILTICRSLITYFGMSNNDIELALKSVTDEISKVCRDLQSEGGKKVR